MFRQALKKQSVLGVGIDDVNLDQAVGIVKGWFDEKSKKRHYIVTPNPEFIMAAQDDSEFKNILNKADLAIPDGAGLKLSGKIKNTVAGIDLMENLCKLSVEKGFTVGFLGGRQGAAEKTAECLKKKYPGLKIAFVEDGPEVDGEGNVLSIKYYGKKNENERLLIQCDMLFVGFGQVKQEKWIAKNLDDLSVNVMMGVGGSFDEISGKVLRCPKWIQKIGLKWLFRLILQPCRIRRQFQLLRFVLLVKK